MLRRFVAYAVTTIAVTTSTVGLSACGNGSERLALPDVSGINDQFVEFRSLEELAASSILIAVVRPTDDVRYVDLAGSPTPITTMKVLSVVAGPPPGDAIEVVQGYVTENADGSETPLIHAETDYLVFLERFVLGADNGDDGSPRTEYNSTGGPAGIFMKLDAESDSFTHVDQHSVGIPATIKPADARGLTVAQEVRPSAQG